MNSVFGRLMWAATLRRASAMEEWLVQHITHYPPPYIEAYSDDPFTQRTRCPCGASATFTVVVNVETRSVPK